MRGKDRKKLGKQLQAVQGKLSGLPRLAPERRPLLEQVNEITAQLQAERLDSVTRCEKRIARESEINKQVDKVMRLANDTAEQFASDEYKRKFWTRLMDATTKLRLLSIRKPPTGNPTNDHQSTNRLD